MTYSITPPLTPLPPFPRRRPTEVRWSFVVFWTLYVAFLAFLGWVIFGV